MDILFLVLLIWNYPKKQTLYDKIWNFVWFANAVQIENWNFLNVNISNRKKFFKSSKAFGDFWFLFWNFFTNQFLLHYFWTEKYLRSGIIVHSMGGTNQFKNTVDTNIHIFLPLPHSGLAGTKQGLVACLWYSVLRYLV